MTCPHHCPDCRRARRRRRWLCLFHWWQLSAWLRTTGLWQAWVLAGHDWPRLREKYRLYIAWRRGARA